MVIQLAKKFLEALVTLFFVASFVFLLMHFAPGSPFLDEHFLQGDNFQLLETYYGLNLPLYEQYVHFIFGILKGDFGPSLSYEGVSVSCIIKNAFPLSLKLGSLAFFMTIFFGLSASFLLALSHNPILKKIISFLNTSALALPSFVACVLLQYLFAIKLDLFPVSGAASWYHLILPAISLSIIPSGIITRLLVNKLKEVLAMPYTLSAKSKGLSPFRLFVFHLIPGAILPTLSYLGPLAATLITGSFACEKVFALPGLGSWFVISLNSRDYPLIAGLTLFYSIFVIAFSFIVDAASSLFDPKLKARAT
jgi:oligopeptide transport system permease protein